MVLWIFKIWSLPNLFLIVYLTAPWISNFFIKTWFNYTGLTCGGTLLFCDINRNTHEILAARTKEYTSKMPLWISLHSIMLVCASKLIRKNSVSLVSFAFWQKKLKRKWMHIIILFREQWNTAYQYTSVIHKYYIYSFTPWYNILYFLSGCSFFVEVFGRE